MGEWWHTLAKGTAKWKVYSIIPLLIIAMLFGGGGGGPTLNRQGVSERLAKHIFRRRGSHGKRNCAEVVDLMGFPMQSYGFSKACL